jgi:hypothetical protein
MIEIPLTQGKVALIDDEDYPLVSTYSWHVGSNHGRPCYAVCDNQGYTLAMHVLLVGKGCDHKNGNGFDNRRSNLRPATASQNTHNQGPRKGTSKYKGVCWHKDTNNWQVGITCSRRQHYLGRFDSEQDAALAYDQAARELHGEFAWLNAQHFPDDFV